MSEVSELAPEATSEDSEAWSEWFPKGKLAGLLEVSEKTIETQVNAGKYQSERRKGRAFVRVPKDSDEFRKISEAATEAPPNESEAAPKSVSTQSEVIPNGFRESSEGQTLPLLIEQLNQAHQAAIKAKDETIANLQAQIEDLKSDKQVLNRHIEASNTAIMRIKDTRKQEAREATKSEGLISKVGRFFKR